MAIVICHPTYIMLVVIYCVFSVLFSCILYRYNCTLLGKECYYPFVTDFYAINDFLTDYIWKFPYCEYMGTEVTYEKLKIYITCKCLKILFHYI